MLPTHVAMCLARARAKIPKLNAGVNLILFDEFRALLIQLFLSHLIYSGVSEHLKVDL